MLKQAGKSRRRRLNVVAADDEWTKDIDDQDKDEVKSVINHYTDLDIEETGVLDSQRISNDPDYIFKRSATDLLNMGKPTAGTKLARWPGPAALQSRCSRLLLCLSCAGLHH